MKKKLKRLAPNQITELSQCEIFVFGSNLEGQHMGVLLHAMPMTILVQNGVMEWDRRGGATQFRRCTGIYPTSNLMWTISSNMPGSIR